MKANRLACAAMLAVVAACASGDAGVAVEEAWARPTAGSAPGVVYARLVNRGHEDERLVGARSGVCRAVEIHRTVRDGDRMEMRPVEEPLAIPARGALELRPGDLHLMLIGLERPLATGERFEVVLELERGGEIAFSPEVRRP